MWKHFGSGDFRSFGSRDQSPPPTPVEWVLNYLTHCFPKLDGFSSVYTGMITVAPLILKYGAVWSWFEAETSSNAFEACRAANLSTNFHSSKRNEGHFQSFQRECVMFDLRLFALLWLKKEIMTRFKVTNEGGVYFLQWNRVLELRWAGSALHFLWEWGKSDRKWTC